MKLLPLLLFLPACASTVVRDPITGNEILNTQADIIGLVISSKNLKLNAVSVNHSVPTREGGNVVAKAATGIGGILTAAGVVRP